MLQVCDESYWKGMESLMPEDAPCGKIFDDEKRMTICPHDPL